MSELIINRNSLYSQVKGTFLVSRDVLEAVARSLSAINASIYGFQPTWEQISSGITPEDLSGSSLCSDVILLNHNVDALKFFTQTPFKTFDSEEEMKANAKDLLTIYLTPISVENEVLSNRCEWLYVFPSEVSVTIEDNLSVLSGWDILEYAYNQADNPDFRLSDLSGGEWEIIGTTSIHDEDILKIWQAINTLSAGILSDYATMDWTDKKFVALSGEENLSGNLYKISDVPNPQYGQYHLSVLDSNGNFFADLRFYVNSDKTLFEQLIDGNLSIDTSFYFMGGRYGREFVATPKVSAADGNYGAIVYIIRYDEELLNMPYAQLVFEVNVPEGAGIELTSGADVVKYCAPEYGFNSTVTFGYLPYNWQIANGYNEVSAYFEEHRDMRRYLDPFIDRFVLSSDLDRLSSRIDSKANSISSLARNAYNIANAESAFWNWKDNYGSISANNAIVIGNEASVDINRNNIAIGKGAVANGYGMSPGVAIGENVKVEDSIGIGKSIRCNSSSDSVFIGHNIYDGELSTFGRGNVVIGGQINAYARFPDTPLSGIICIGERLWIPNTYIAPQVTKPYAIQLGYGTNDEVSSFQVHNWKVLDHNGGVPYERISAAIKANLIDCINSPTLSNSINGDRIVSNTMSGAKIKSGTISGEKLQDGLITTSKLRDNAVTPAKLDREYIPLSSKVNVETPFVLSQTVPNGSNIVAGCAISVQLNTDGSSTIALGNGKANYNGAIAIGGKSSATINNAIAIGYNANSYGTNAIQLGAGTNQSSGTLKFRNYPLFKANGDIVEDRISNSVSAYISKSDLANALSSLSNVVDFNYDSIENENSILSLAHNVGILQTVLSNIQQLLS